MARVHAEPFEIEGGAARAAASLSERPGLAWLDADGRTERGRFAFVGSDPVEVRRRSTAEGWPLEVFDELVAAEAPDAGGRPRSSAPPPSRVPQWAGYIGYDATRARDGRGAAARADEPASPGVWLGRYDAWACFDAARGRAWLVGDDEAACSRLRRRLAEGEGTVPRAKAMPALAEPAGAHLAAIEAALAHIAAGDIYQVNLARRWRAPFEGAPVALALAMHRASPVPLGFFADAGDHAVVSRTMETFLEWSGPGGDLRTRPIKGTIARCGDDARAAASLQADAKERAEHSMIVDLMRNDLGRVARTGSVKVEETLKVEPYARLSHLVSTIACRTRPDVGPREILEATFPPGSVTGTPKLRAMQLIEQLERVPRGVYCGAIGHVSRTGAMRWAVAIRTAQVRDDEAVYHAGGGIVEASDPQRELAETKLKARAFLDALVDDGRVGRFVGDGRVGTLPSPPHKG